MEGLMGEEDGGSDSAVAQGAAACLEGSATLQRDTGARSVVPASPSSQGRPPENTIPFGLLVKSDAHRVALPGIAGKAGPLSCVI